MSIQYDEQKKIFTLHTVNTTYQMKVDQYGFLLHLYYGPKTEGEMDYLLTFADRGFCGNPYDTGKDRTYSMDVLPQEYPVQGNGDYRSSALIIRNNNGTYSCDIRYQSHAILEGKYNLPGLPALYAGKQDAQTLEITMEDAVTGIQVVLRYAVLPDKDIITRSVQIKNNGHDTAWIEKISSACLDFLYGTFELVHFHGRHAMERNMQRSPLMHGIQTIGSKRGTSSHQHNPFMILADKNTTEEFGNCYGLSFLYSGNFLGEVEIDQLDQTRVLIGLQEELFCWQLAVGEEFCAPEVAMSFSAEGLGTLSANYHRAYRNNLCRGKYKLQPRPVLINNWEATYFDFTGDKIYDIAKQAAELGVEMLVLDDGWFGKREDDNSGLGDWYVNESKLQGTIGRLAERINELGIQFGLWVEPEMVSEDSDLYRAHPDWAFQIPGRRPVRGRNQLLLDFSREEIRNTIYEQLCKILDSANIAYIKWDMNRSITDVYSALADSGRQGETLHRFVLGVYEVLEKLLRRYPELLIEGCSGGGGRYDAGMLYYTPQIWCSDNTDAIDRIRIQYGTSFGYPISTVGSHVSAVPNHQTERITPMNTRGIVAMSGSFGYELDLNKITEEEKICVKEQIQRFHQYWDMIHNGVYYRLSNPFTDTDTAAWEFVKEDKTEALLNIVILNHHGNQPARYIRLRGLEEKAVYKLEGTDKVYQGAALMYAGLAVPMELVQYQAVQLHFIKMPCKE